jgi:1-deoxy-D-xylulose-5-phosphate reductoisomerase
MTRRGVAILGSTGSIGESALSVVDAAPEQFEVVGLAAGRNLTRLAQQIERHRPQIVSVAQEADLELLRQLLAGRPVLHDLELLSGEAGTVRVAADPRADVVLTAMVGAAGLCPTLAALARGASVAIANKEPLVIAGELCSTLAKTHGATIVPVDSEHSAIHQCLHGHQRGDVERILLTCSGGPFRQRSDLSQVTIAQALDHPTWSMGKKITIDSATLMNKGLEVIEAHWLFDLRPNQIEVLIHPQSVIHSMVEFHDGSVLAQLGTPDMRVPVAYGLSYPNRVRLPWPKLDWSNIGPLSFEQADRARFPCLDLAYEALRSGELYPAVLNAANEVAVDAFLAGRLPFVAIPALIERVMEEHDGGGAFDLERIKACDSWARNKAALLLDGFA